MSDTLTFPPPSIDFGGKHYVGVNVSPRGFANEFSIYVATADNAGRLQTMIDRSTNRDAGDNYRARWLDSDELRKHLFGIAKGDHPRAVLTIDANGNPDAFLI
jgi:hypothetical protein